MRMRPLLLVFLAMSTYAQEAPFLGPLRIRDLSPIAALRLDFIPAHGFYGSTRGQALRINYSEANVFIVSDAVADYLRKRNRPDPLGPQDIQAILSPDGDVFFFDGEIGTVDVEYIRSISDHMQLQVEWPILMRGGGFLDRFIEGFHEVTGLNTAYRDLTARNDFQVVTRIGTDTLVLNERGTDAATGDPTVSLRHVTKLGRGRHLTTEVGVKVPVGDEARFFFSGDFDYGLQMSLQQQWERQALYLDASYVWVGDIRVFPNFPLNNSPTITAAWERRIGLQHWAIVQGSWSRSTFKGAAESAFTDDRTQVSIGWRQRLSPHLVTTAALTENVIRFKNTPDFAIHFSMGWIFPGRSAN